uniref:Uncharacterized protein n=1 Tax=Anguilla anguilla TaxID=7936 RepID=A0A0E9WE70_ANGAN
MLTVVAVAVLVMLWASFSTKSTGEDLSMDSDVSKELGRLRELVCRMTDVPLPCL